MYLFIQLRYFMYNAMVMYLAILYASQREFLIHASDAERLYREPRAKPVHGGLPIGWRRSYQIG